MIELKDKYNRKHDYLRISLTDKCNFNCIYCNPGKPLYEKADKDYILTFEEIERIITIFASIGFKKIRFTGGEPLARRNISDLFEKVLKIKNQYGFELSMTTNASLIFDKLETLKSLGLDRLNISLDSLSGDTFKKITGSDRVQFVFNSLYAAIHLFGFTDLKINTVIMKGINDNELLDFTKYAIKKDINVRFIEFMPFSGNGWNSDLFISSEIMKEIICKSYSLIKIPNQNAVAEDYQIENQKGKISFISPISKHFCAGCNRLRITADGFLKLCLFSGESELLDLKSLLRDNSLTDNEIIKLIINHIDKKEFEHRPVDELIKLNNNNMLKIGG